MQIERVWIEKSSMAMIYLELFTTFFFIGMLTIGGGYAMLALLENEYVLKREWMTKDEFLDMAAIAESTPGPIAINSATYIGYKKYGVIGSVVATLGICIPSFVIIYLVFFHTQNIIIFICFAFKFLPKLLQIPRNTGLNNRIN